MIIYIIEALLILVIGRVSVTFSIGRNAKFKICEQNDNLSSYNNTKYVLWFLLLTCISGFRGETVGTDTAGYLNIFLGHNGLSSGYTNQEFLFAELCKGIGLFTTNPQWFLIITSAIITFGVLFFVRRNSKYDALSVFYYMALYYYFFSMNGLRQFIAISLVLIATEFSKNRKLIPFVVFIALAVGFHTTALLGISMWFIFIPNASTKRLVAIIGAMSALIVGFSYIQGFVAKYFTDYSSLISGHSYSVEKMMPIVYSFIFLAAAFVAFADKEWRSNPHNMSLLCIAAIAMVWGLSPLILKSISTNISQRIGWYFQIYSIVLIPKLLESKLFKEKRSIYYILFVCVGMAHMVYFLSKGWHRVVPYSFSF